MKNNNQEILDKVYMELSKLLFALNINYDSFSHHFRKQYVLITHENCKTKLRTSLKTNVDRRMVTSILKNEYQFKKKIILINILNKIEKLAAKNNGIVAKEGKKSVQAIIEKIANGAATVPSVVIELSNAGFIEDNGYEIKFIRKNIQIIDEKKLALSAFLQLLDNYIKSITILNE